MVAILFWVVIVGFSFVLELHSNAFIAVFIGFGAAISFVLALAGLPFTFQAGAWLVVSAVSLVTLRPFAMRKFHHHRFEIDMSQPTNTAMTDMRGTVEMPVGDATHPGRVKIQGESWKAVTDWPAQLPEARSSLSRRPTAPHSGSIPSNSVCPNWTHRIALTN